MGVLLRCTELDEKDVHDMRLLHARFALPSPWPDPTTRSAG
jgi:hypothetical protein